MDWDDINGVKEYRVYRDQTLIAKQSFFTDNSVNENSKYIYEIEYDLPLTKEEKDEVQRFFKDNSNLSEEEIEQKSATRPVSIIREVSTTSSFSSLLAATPSFSWYYKTFIPIQYADDPIPGNGISYYGGDNRDFSFESEKYRTKMWAKTVFGGGTATHEFDKAVGLTTAYDENYKLVNSAYASTTLMYGNELSRTSSTADYMYYHKSGNPFVLPGQEIDYQMRVTTNSNGSYSFEGIHDRAPSHELYLSLYNGASNRMIFAHPNEGFEYLGAPSTLARQFYISGSY